jgi:hypothetical protein
MVFWILLGIAALIPIVVAIFFFMDEGFLAGVGFFFVSAFLAACGLGLVALILSAIAAGTGWTDTRYETRDLRALGNSSSIEGRFYFLGGGYIDGKRVLNYIVQQDGYSTLEQADANDSRIFEDEQESPYVYSAYSERKNTWLVPWPVLGGEAHDFHIPADSILENYTIDNSAG